LDKLEQEVQRLFTRKSVGGPTKENVIGGNFPRQESVLRFLFSALILTALALFLIRKVPFLKFHHLQFSENAKERQAKQLTKKTIQRKIYCLLNVWKKPH